MRAETNCAAPFADAVSLQDVDWDTQDGHYRVRIQGEWIVVPDDSVVTEPNRFGPAVDAGDGTTRIRCSSLVPARSHHLFGGDVGQCPLLGVKRT